MSDVFAEMQEAIKQEKLDNFLRTYGGYIIIFALAIILGTAVNAGYSAWKNDETRKETSALIKTIDNKDPQELLNDAEKLKMPGLKLLAKLDAAGEYLKNNDNANALSIYNSILEDKTTPKEYKDFSLLMSLKISDSLTPEQKIISLEKIWNDTKNPFSIHARLEAAIIMAHDLDNLKGAIEHLDAIKNNELSPENLKRKAASLSALYDAKLGKTLEVKSEKAEGK